MVIILYFFELVLNLPLPQAARILDILVYNFRTRDGIDKIMCDSWSARQNIVIFKIPALLYYV